MKMVKIWIGYMSSMLVGIIGWLNQFSEMLDLVFVILGIIGLSLSICLTIKKLLAKDNKSSIS
jgi:hypothetical protein